MFTYSSRSSRSSSVLGAGLLGFVMVGAAACSGNVQLDPAQTSAGGNTVQISNTSAVVTGGSVAQSDVARGGSVAQSDVARGGSVAQSDVARGGSVAQSDVARGGSVAHSSQGGSRAFSTVDCEYVECFRAVNCVETCGGPVLQSGCCPCPSGTIDSIECFSTGGSGGQSSVSAGGASGLGGQSSSSAAGGVTTGGSSATPVGAECAKDQDCQLTGDCCGCHSLPLNAQSDCAAPCETHPGTCSDVGYLTQKAEPACIGGRCALRRNCDDSRVVCKMATPVCPKGRVPGVTPDGTCWDGDCINAEECSEVSSCSVCTSNNLMCLYSNGTRGVAHCMKEPGACKTNSLCACYGALCNGVGPCSELQFGDYGISCGGG